MAERVVLVRLRAETQAYNAAMQQASAHTKGLGRDVAAQTGNMRQLGNSMMLAGGGIVAGFGLAAKAAIDFESAWAGVTKTVEGTPEQLAAIRDGIRDMSKELPASREEIAAVAEAAGQLGIQTENVLGFTRVMIDLGETTNLSADQAATAIARIVNIMGTAQGEVDRLGATLVALGNDGASTEAEIVEMALRISGAGKQIGLTEADVLGFANALSSVGIEAEAGGSSISRVFVNIATAVETGNDKLAGFAKVAGMSTAEFRKAFQDDAAGAIVAFIEGLGNMQKAGGNVFGVLESLGLEEIRVRDALLRTAGAGDLVRQSLDLGAQAWEENTALTAEAEKRYETTAAKLEMLWNQVTDLAVTLGESLLPIIADVVDMLTPLIEQIGSLFEWFGRLPGPIQQTVIGLGVFLGASALARGAFLRLKAAILDNVGAAKSIGGVFGKLGFAGATAAAATATVAIYGLSEQMATNKRRAEMMRQAQNDLADAMKEQGDVVGETTRQWTINALRSSEVGQKVIGTMADMGVSIADLETAITGPKEAYDDFVDALIEGGDFKGFDETAIRTALSMLAEAYSGAKQNAEDFEKVQGEAGDATKDAGDQFEVAGRKGKGYADAVEDAGGAAKDAKKPTDDLSEALERAEKRAKRARDQFDLLFGGTLSMQEAELGALEALDHLNETMADAEASNLDVRSAIFGVIDAYGVVRETQIATGTSTEEANRKFAETTAGLFAVMEQTNASNDAMVTYGATLGLTPEEVRTLIALDDDEAVQFIIDTLQGKLETYDKTEAEAKVKVDASQAFAVLESLFTTLAQVATLPVNMLLAFMGGGDFAGGGTVPGPMGKPTPIMAHGGEVIVDPRDPRQGMSELAAAGILHPFSEFDQHFAAAGSATQPTSQTTSYGDTNVTTRVTVAPTDPRMMAEEISRKTARRVGALTGSAR